MNAEQINKSIQRVLAGEVRAYEPLVDAHKQFIYNLVLSIVKNQPEAEELTMDVFIKAYDKLHTFKGEAKFSTWLYTIAYRLALMHLRKHKPYKEEINDQHHVKSEDQLKESDVNYVIEIALKDLTEIESALINFYYLKELNLREIEEITGIKAETAKVKIHRIRKKLSTILEKRFSSDELKTIMTF
ncbi:RNA polymerase sigma factor [Marivirga atlantica]|uniref:Sigma-70 family RNA polymerase sigma factor n=1 Tax=Marivirga atlantica TaxID=1548457 RepID=A0A937DJC9_9BACT|nr:sigma-70 family RNA polymerase sigma factor [Marivirga atlantica]MBL0765081.1 sigma-70 family RNA polymerase sigma factor [Marivirga atlantica]